MGSEGSSQGGERVNMMKRRKKRGMEKGGFDG